MRRRGSGKRWERASHERADARWELLGLVVILVLLVVFAIPYLVGTRTTSAPNACINNLRLIDGAKQQWAREKGKGPEDTPAFSDIQPYLGRGKGGMPPTCPVDSNNNFTSSYSINSVATKPTCKMRPTIHVLP
jgi:hypothetical protein